MSVQTVRQSRKHHKTGRRANPSSGPGNDVENTGLDNGQMISMTKEARPFGSSTGRFPLTPQAKAAEDVDHGIEGPVRGRQSDKSSL
jgi:hypothetical protein